jgi:hypothetical protein
MREAEQPAVAIWLRSTVNTVSAPWVAAVTQVSSTRRLRSKPGNRPKWRVARTFELSLEKESRVDLAFHQDGAGAAESDCPGLA